MNATPTGGSATPTGSAAPARAEALRFDPATSAVVVIDPQNDFCHPDGLHGRLGKDTGGAQAVLPRLAALLDHARRHGVPVVFVRTTHDETTDSAAWDDRHVEPRPARTCVTGSWGAEFCGVAPEAGETVVVKHRYSAFAGTAMRETLTRMGRTSLLFTGFATGTCVENSVREAVCRDFLVTLVEDCCADYTTEAHERAVEAIEAGYGLVSSSERIAQVWSAWAADADAAHAPEMEPT